MNPYNASPIRGINCRTLGIAPTNHCYCFSNLSPLQRHSSIVSCDFPLSATHRIFLPVGVKHIYHVKDLYSNLHLGIVLLEF